MRQVHRMRIVLTRLMRRAQLVVLAGVAMLNRDEHVSPGRRNVVQCTAVARVCRRAWGSCHGHVLRKHLHGINFDIQTDVRASSL